MTEGFSISLSMTKKIGVKGITSTLLATFLFLSMGPSLFVAQYYSNICFYANAHHCYGPSKCCRDLSPPRCCQNFNRTLGRSTSVSPHTDTGTSKIYTDNECRSLRFSHSGYLCLVGEGVDRYNSGKWTRTYNTRDGAELGNEESCNETVSPDTFEYKFITEDRRRASWVLPMASLAEADSYGPLLDLPAEEQVLWFKSRGATLEVEDHRTTPDPDYTQVPDKNMQKCPPRT